MTTTTGKGAVRHMHVSATWTAAIGDFSDYLTALGRSPRTVDTRATWLRLFAATTPDPWAVTRRDVVAWMAHQTWKPATRASAHQSLQQFYRWGIEEGLVDVDPLATLPRAKVPTGQPHPVAEEAFHAALNNPDLTSRERLAVMLAGHCGLRRGEIARVRGEDLGDNGLLVRGKGGKQRFVPVSTEVRQLITACGPGWVLPARWGEGHMNVDAVGKMIRRAMGGACGPHALRHRMASVSYGATHDLLAVQRLLGHSQPGTTQIYCAVSDAALAAAIAAAA